MKYFLPFLVFMSLLLFSDNIVAARKDVGNYWRAVMKEQPMPEALEELVRIEVASAGNDEETKCNTPSIIELKEEKIIVGKKSIFADVFEPRLSVTAYVGDEKSSFTKDFEPRPSVTAYVGNEKLSFTKDFEPRPSVTAYVGDEKSSFTKDFDPRPSVTAYVGSDSAVHIGEAVPFTSDFEPEPTATS